MSIEVVHGDGIVPVAQVVLRVGRLLLPPHTAHCQQDGCGESPSQRSRLGGDKCLSPRRVQRRWNCTQPLTPSIL